MSGGGCWYVRGERNSSRGGLGSLGGRLLDSRLLSSEKRRIRDGKQQQWRRMSKGYLDLGRLMVVVFSDGISNFALR
jgi:hypothetical protein